MGEVALVFSGFESGWRTRIKEKAWAKIYASPLMQGCTRGDIRYVRALLAGYWNFVERFPEIIEGTFSTIPSDIPGQAETRPNKFLRRAARILAGTLESMQNDERQHRVLWLKSAAKAGLGYSDLTGWRVLSEVEDISSVIGAANVRTKLLYFAAVEIVAEGISKCLSESDRFRGIMENEGMRWFDVHLRHPENVTTHEDLAYQAVERLFQEEGIEPTEQGIDEDIQVGVDLFIRAAQACATQFAGSRVPVSE